MSRIAVLHPGQMGAEVARTLAEAGHDVGWLPTGRGSGTRRRAGEATLKELDGLADREIVISICPPAAAVDTARTTRGFKGLYVDANAVSPRTAEEVAGTVRGWGARYVDGGIIGPPPHRAGTTRLYLSGDDAHQIVSIFEGTRIEPIVVLGSETAASALKMTYAAWTKVSSALLVSVWDAAQGLGVAEELAREWSRSQSGLADRHARAVRSSEEKGWRWSAEMAEIAQTFAEVGQPSGFGEAAAELFARLPRPVDD